jgi:hypothetical protein
MIFSDVKPYIIGSKYHSTLTHYCQNLKYCMYSTYKRNFWTKDNLKDGNKSYFSLTFDGFLTSRL